MMKYSILCILVFAFFVSTINGQSLRDNSDYMKSLELQEQSREAFDQGDFTEAKRLAEEAQIYAEKSDIWISKQLARYRANSALLQVRNRFVEIDRINGKANFPDEYAAGKNLQEQAYQEFRDEKWEMSQTSSNAAMNALASISYVSNGRLPASYVVRLLPGNSDCFWNIAGYEFVYGNPWEWRTLYEANKSKLPERNNPNLILPGMVLDIPAQSGETRSGTWVDGKIRP